MTMDNEILTTPALIARQPRATARIRRSSRSMAG